MEESSVARSPSTVRSTKARTIGGTNRPAAITTRAYAEQLVDAAARQRRWEELARKASAAKE